MRNIVVTGGSRGIGLGIVRRLAAAGDRAIAIARNGTDGLNEAKHRARRKKRGAVDFAQFDLSDIEAIPALVQRLRKQFGPIYGLVNNAAVGPAGVLALTPEARIEHVLRVNIASPLVLTKYVVRSMMSSGGGRVVNISSVVAFTGYSGLSVYAASKAALIGFTRSLAREVGGLGVNVNAVAPGFVETEMTKELDAEQRQQVARRSALRRLPNVEDVASAVEFLLGDGASGVTGTVLTVDAGNTA